MANLSVRNLDDDLVAKLKRLAARHGRSSEAEVKDILRLTVSGEADIDFDVLAAEPRALTRWCRHEPIDGPSKGDPIAFGLGVGAGFRPAIGAYWYFQGMTLGYRVLYAYFPKNGAVIVVGLNSQPDDKPNHNGALLDEIYGLLRTAGKI